MHASIELSIRSISSFILSLQESLSHVPITAVTYFIRKAEGCFIPSAAPLFKAVSAGTSHSAFVSIDVSCCCCKEIVIIQTTILLYDYDNNNNTL